MTFRYRLQKIVDLKSNERTQAEWLLSAALSRLHREEEQLQRLIAAKEELEQMLDHAARHCLKIAEIINIQDYITHIESQIEAKNRAVQQAQQVVHKQKSVLKERMIDEKVWDKAREKAYQLHRATALKAEQEQLDDIVTLRFNIT